MKRIYRETTIAKTDTYRVFTTTNTEPTTYIIEYADRNFAAPLPWYRTLDGVKEALYYAGLLESKDSPLG